MTLPSIEAVAKGPSLPDPLVSVVLLTYNHEPFIEDALLGVLGQVAPFDIEVIVTEDCSTDATLEVVERIRQGTTWDFTVLSSPVNLCSNTVVRRALDIARGEFVAVLDGDDYWTDEHKLERQVEFLRRHPDFSMCFHDVLKVDDASGTVVEETVLGTVELTRCDLVRGHPLPPACSPLVRREALSGLPESFDDADFGDWPLHLQAVHEGRVGGIGATMGVYRLHAGGIWTGAPEAARWRTYLAFLDALDIARDDPCWASWQEGRGLALWRIAVALVEQGRGSEARRFARRALASPGASGYGRWATSRLLTLAIASRLYRHVLKVRHSRSTPWSP